MAECTQRIRTKELIVPQYARVRSLRKVDAIAARNTKLVKLSRTVGTKAIKDRQMGNGFGSKSCHACRVVSSDAHSCKQVFEKLQGSGQTIRQTSKRSCALGNNTVANDFGQYGARLSLKVHAIGMDTEPHIATHSIKHFGKVPHFGEVPILVWDV